MKEYRLDPDTKQTTLIIWAVIALLAAVALTVWLVAGAYS
jgi:hypothetical protein